MSDIQADMEPGDPTRPGGWPDILSTALHWTGVEGPDYGGQFSHNVGGLQMVPVHADYMTGTDPSRHDISDHCHYRRRLISRSSAALMHVQTPQLHVESRLKISQEYITETFNNPTNKYKSLADRFIIIILLLCT